MGFDAIEFRKKLRAWFEKNQRTLPWRKEGLREAYSVVVSEVMLQQTQVTTVLHYYDKWMAEFPSFEALAKTPLERVLKAWEGMGYYSRARNLQKLAQAVVERHGGRLPQTVEALEDLPGIGRYSARSIASLAFGVAAACVDGNVVRVLARLKGIDKQYKSASAAQHDFQKIADEVLDEKNAGLHNEAMMEFGATICTKAAPRCTGCPMREMCAAYATGRVEELPRFEAKKIESRLVKRVWVVREGKLLLMRDNAAHGNLEGLWELPTAEALGIKRLPKKEKLRRVRNITRYKITEVIYEIAAAEGVAQKADALERMAWAGKRELAKMALSGPHRQWVEELLGRKGAAGLD